MKIKFAPFTRFDQAEIAAKAMEITAGIAGHCMLEDLAIDEDELLDQMLENAEEFDIETEAKNLVEERFSGKKLAREKFGYLVSKVLKDRNRKLSAGHPFDLEIGDEPSLVRHEILTNAPIYGAAFALTLFILLEDQEVVEISDKDREVFRRKFGELFELIAAHALSSKVEGIVWWTGKARGRTIFLKQLSRLARIIGNGTIKSEDQLEDNQIHVNDGGVDAIGVSTHEGVVEADAICFLLGATYQRNERKNKIVGAREISRFREFFVNVPTVAFQGILSIPYSEVNAEAQDCRDQNCVYFPQAVIERNLGIASTKEYAESTLPYVKLLGKQMIDALSLTTNDLKIVKKDITYHARELFR